MLIPNFVMSEKEPLSIQENNIVEEGINITPSNSLTDKQDYLQTDEESVFYQEWPSLFHQQEMNLDLCIEHPYTVSFDVKYPKFADLQDNLDTARIFMGIKDPQKEYQECIEMGIYKGRIYMKDLFDVVNIPLEKLVEGVKLVLDVAPLPLYGKCSSTLKVQDLNGEVISAIKTSRIFKKDWRGGMSPGLHIKSFCIQGIQSSR